MKILTELIVTCHSHSGRSRWSPRNTYTGLNIVRNFTTCENQFQTMSVCRRHVDMDDSVDDDDIINMYWWLGTDIIGQCSDLSDRWSSMSFTLLMGLTYNSSCHYWDYLPGLVCLTQVPATYLKIIQTSVNTGLNFHNHHDNSFSIVQ